MGKVIRKRFDVLIEQPESEVSKTFELDKTVKFITGLLVTSDRDDLLFYRGSQKIDINKEEIFPEAYESKLIMSGINVSPNQRYYDIGKMDVGNGRIRIEYKDKENLMSRFEPYRVSLYVTCELINE